MAEPEHTTMHNFAYRPSVANWVQSTALAQLDGASDEVTEPAPDDFYKSAPTHPAGHEPSPFSDDMTTTRQRQQNPNGAARSTPKPSIRSVSGPATSTTPASRATPQIPANRPTVRSLAQKFNQPSSAESSPASSRARPVRPATHTKSTADSPVSKASASSPARPAKEVSYGTYKFNNLKPRERPQPAPASPAGVRRTTGRRPSVDKQTPPSKPPSKPRLSTPSRGTGRQPFFGEVIGEHNASTPGFGIPNLEPPSDSASLPAAEGSTIKIVSEDAHFSPEHSHHESLPSGHQRSASDALSQPASESQASQPPLSPDSRTPRRRSPPSRIPVATRRMSAASDSSSSTRSLKFGSARPVGPYSRTSPTRLARVPVGRGSTSPKKSKAPAQTTLPAVSYRGYRERGKSPKGTNSGPSVAAVITAPLPPTSPRLRNSRERQLLQESPGARSRSSEPHASQDYFGNGNPPTAQDQPPVLEPEHVEDAPSVKHVDPATDVARESVDVPTVSTPQPELAVNGQDSSAAMAHPQTLSLHTDSVHLQPPAPPSTSATDFEYDESPVLGMPGSFMMTPPVAQYTPPMEQKHVDDTKPELPPAPAPVGELLQAVSFRPSSKGRMTETVRTEDVQAAPSELGLSEFGLRESIPIMLGSDGPHAGWNAPATRSRHSPRLSIGAQRWRVEPLDSTGTISYLEDDDSPTDPLFTNRDTLRPDDSASVAFYRQIGQRSPNWTPKIPNVQEAGSFTLDSEAYSVINKVLNVYHQSDLVTPELAQDSQQQVHSVSPIIAQHKDWGSKEATETYLARLLSDAAGSEERRCDPEPVMLEQPNSTATHTIPALSIRALDEDPDEPIVGGTAIIFPPESRRYSRGSRGSGGSTTTTIWEGTSRPDSSSGSLARDYSHGNNTLQAHAPQPPLKDWSPLQSVGDRSIQLPEIAGTGEGLGLSLQSSQQQLQYPQQQTLEAQQPQAPPRPLYSPPPPPKPRTPAHNLQQQDTVRMSGLGVLGSNELDPQDGLDVTVPLEQYRDEAAEAAKSTEEAIAAEATPVIEPERAPAAITNLQKRYRSIEELTKTEHTFCIDMMVAHQIFELTGGEVLNDQERRILFGNCKELEKFSHTLWKALKEAIKPIVNPVPPPKQPGQPYDEFLNLVPERDRMVNVGAVILQAVPRMERLFTTYFLNWDDASEFIKKNGSTPEIAGWAKACFEHSDTLTNAWSLDSLLVKPCQRILKYPLLLEQLASVTAPDHPDLPQIKAAADAIMAVSARINMAKKRQDTLRAATSEGKKQKNKGLGDRFGKSIVKALISNKDRTKIMQEAATIFEDQEYNSVTQKFGGHFFQIQIVIRDFEQYLDAITDQIIQLNIVNLGFVAMSETGPSSNPEIESTWRRWAMAYLDIQNKALDEHKSAVRSRVMAPINAVWDQWAGPQKLMEQRKKSLVQYAKYKQSLDRKEKVDPKLEEAAQDFLTINDSLKLELPKLYDLTKTMIRLGQIIFIGIQKEWYKTVSKKILPLLEDEPQHTTSITYDFKVYTDRFKSDFSRIEERAKNLAIVNHDLLNNVAMLTSPVPTFYSDDGSSRKSSSRRTESIGSDMSMVDARNRNSGGYPSSRSQMRSFEGPPRSSPATSYTVIKGTPLVRTLGSDTLSYATNPISPRSETSEATVTPRSPGARPPNPNVNWTSLDGTYDDMYTSPASIGASFLNPVPGTSNPGSSRASGVFNSALPMADSPSRPTASMEDPPATPGDMDEPEVLFLAASLFEFNIAHDRREGGIPYLVYVPGEIFDVIGMKGELWLARNQDDPNRTVGWIWEKHFARILPEDA